MRVFLIVIDSFGVGEMPDAKEFGDQGSNTFLNINITRYYLKFKVFINSYKFGINF